MLIETNKQTKKASFYKAYKETDRRITDRPVTTEVKDRDLYTRGDQQMERRLGAEKAGNQTKTGEGTRSATQKNNQWQMRKIRTIKERENRSGAGGKKLS